MEGRVCVGDHDTDMALDIAQLGQSLHLVAILYNQSDPRVIVGDLHLDDRNWRPCTVDGYVSPVAAEGRPVCFRKRHASLLGQFGIETLNARVQLQVVMDAISYEAAEIALGDGILVLNARNCCTP